MSRDNYVVELKRSAIKELTALDPKLRERIRDKIDALAENPRPRGAIKLKGNFDAWRIWVADYRIMTFPGIDGHRIRPDNEINLTGGARDGKEKRKQQILRR